MAKIILIKTLGLFGFSKKDASYKKKKIFLKICKASFVFFHLNSDAYIKIRDLILIALHLHSFKREHQ
jgi:hypothetical protein